LSLRERGRSKCRTKRISTKY